MHRLSELMADADEPCKVAFLACPSMDLRFNEAEGEAVQRMLIGIVAKKPWGFGSEIATSAGNVIMEWQRVGLTAGYAHFKQAGKTAAAAIMLGGNDADDSLAIEGLKQADAPSDANQRQQLIKASRASFRPQICVAFTSEDRTCCHAIANLAMGMGKLLFLQLNLQKTMPPLGNAKPADFPSRLFHFQVANGQARNRGWVDATLVQEVPNLAKIVAVMTNQFDDSISGFEDKIILEHAQSEHPFQVRWMASHKSAGKFEIIDRKNTRHEILLLGGTDHAAEANIFDGYRAALPPSAAGVFQATLREFPICPRPMLVELMETKPEAATTAAAKALALAFFVWLGLVALPK